MIQQMRMQVSDYGLVSIRRSEEERSRLRSSKRLGRSERRRMGILCLARTSFLAAARAPLQALLLLLRSLPPLLLPLLTIPMRAVVWYGVQLLVQYYASILMSHMLY